MNAVNKENEEFTTIPKYKQCHKHTLFYNVQKMKETSVTCMKIENKSNKHQM